MTSNLANERLYQYALYDRLSVNFFKSIGVSNTMSEKIFQTLFAKHCTAWIHLLSQKSLKAVEDLIESNDISARIIWRAIDEYTKADSKLLSMFRFNSSSYELNLVYVN